METNPGSVIDVSGAAGNIDVINSIGVTPTVVSGAAGIVNIGAREGIVLQGSLLAQAAPVSGGRGWYVKSLVGSGILEFRRKRYLRSERRHYR